MSKFYTALLIVVSLLLASCSKKDVSEGEAYSVPESEQEFVQLLSSLGIELYPGTIIDDFSSEAKSTLVTLIPNTKGFKGDILAHYRRELNLAFSADEGWGIKVDTPLFILYVNDETGHQFELGINNQAADKEGYLVQFRFFQIIGEHNVLKQ